MKVIANRALFQAAQISLLESSRHRQIPSHCTQSQHEAKTIRNALITQQVMRQTHIYKAERKQGGDKGILSVLSYPLFFFFIVDT